MRISALFSVSNDNSVPLPSIQAHGFIENSLFLRARFLLSSRTSEEDVQKWRRDKSCQGGGEAGKNGRNRSETREGQEEYHSRSSIILHFLQSTMMNPTKGLAFYNSQRMTLEMKMTIFRIIMFPGFSECSAPPSF